MIYFFSMRTKGNNSWVIHFLVFAGLLIPFTQSAAAAEVIQNFENLSAIEVKNGELAPITEGPGVTEGKQAAEMPAGSTITLSPDRGKFSKADWLKIDTLNTRPVPVCLRLTMNGEKFYFSRSAYIKPGGDTIALPLSVCWEPNKVPGKLKLELANHADTGVIVDNIRLEKAVPPPEGARLEDYGYGDTNIWPGFENQRGMINVNLDRNSLSEFSCSAPDPLTGDFIGRSLENTSPYKFSVESQDDLTVWLWVTHYGRNRTQSPVYALKTGKDFLVKAKHSGRQATGAFALTFGQDFDWTPKNFESQYVSRVVDLVKIRVSPGQVFDVMGCQLAAAVYGSTRKEAKLAEYVDMVQEDLARYRRQFVFGASGETFCTVAPTDEESKAGLMVFLPPPDDIYSATWAGDEKCRAGEIQTVVANGGMATVAIAAVPLKKTKNMQVQLSGLKSDDGKPLTGGKDSANAVFLERVPCVRDAKVLFQPWIVSASHGPVEPCRVVWLAVQFAPSENARPGLYKGTFKLICTEGEKTLPVTLKVVSVGQVLKNPVVVSSTDDGSPEGMYGAVYDELSPPQHDSLTAKIRAELIDGGLTGLMIPAASLNNKLKLDDAACLRNMKLYPSKRTGRDVIFSLSGAMWQLRDEYINPNKNEYKEAIKAVVGRTYAIAAKAGIQKPLLYIGRCWGGDSLQNFTDVAAVVAETKGRPAIAISASILNETGEAKLRKLFKPFSAVFVMPNNNSEGVHKKYAVLKEIGCELYSYLSYNDRYQVGFFSFGAGFDGVCLEDLFSRSSPYDGFYLRGSGLLTPDSSGAITQTLSMLRVRQGAYDFQLARRAEELVQKADKAKIPSAGVKSILDNISRQAHDVKWLNYDETLFRTTSVSEKDVESFRTHLTEAAASLAEKLGSK